MREGRADMALTAKKTAQINAAMAAWCNVSWPWVGGPRRLSPQEFFSQRLAVGRKSLLKCFKLRFLGFADHKSLIYCHIAVDHCWSLRRERRSYTGIVGVGQLPTHRLRVRLHFRKFDGTASCGRHNAMMKNKRTTRVITQSSLDSTDGARESARIVA